ncbi:MAG: replication-associated recombination protein A [Flavobacteriales bacterium]|nr:replication-associated recombination protein A [Flavobacteriales bacterium]
MASDRDIPLAERMRPRKLADFVGQKHLVGPDGAITRMVQSGILPSMILWGPPGVGKTTLAQILADEFGRELLKLNAINSGVKDIRDIIEKAERSNFIGQFKKPIVFIDEIHRFNKSQQDSLLGAVEKGTICLIGATTENPSFEVISALLSRCQTFVLEALSKDDLLQVLQHALQSDEWLRNRKVEFVETDALLAMSGGDARKLLNFLEMVVGSFSSSEKPIITNERVMAVLQQVMPMYDKNGEMHYDIISAFIKSLRGSDPQAAVYWLARMLNGGEDPKFIARRMLILASEDIGNANPNALLLANACFQAIDVIGMPEARIILSQTAIYLACSAKSNASYVAINKAMETVKQTGNLAVPLHLRNAPTKLMKELNYGVGYQYAHDFPGNFVEQEFMPQGLEGTIFYQPGDNVRENEIKSRLCQLWKNKYRL